MEKSEIKELNRLWQEVIHARDRYCQICYRQDGLAGHHIFTRSRKNTCWDLENGIGLCYSCHCGSSLLSAHKTPRNFFRWLENKKGKKWVNDLEIRSQMTARYLDAKLIKIYLTQELKKYGI